MFFMRMGQTSKKLHYTINCDQSEDYVLEKKYYKQSLVGRGKIILPPLHVKLGLQKNFVMNEDGEGFKNKKKIVVN